MAAKKLIPTTYTIFMPNDKAGEHKKFTVNWPKEPTLAMLHTVLDPVFGKDWFEHVYTMDDRRSMFVDENGLLKHLPLNAHVSYQYYNGPIVGPAVVFDRCVWY